MTEHGMLRFSKIEFREHSAEERDELWARLDAVAEEQGMSRIVILRKRLAAIERVAMAAIRHMEFHERRLELSAKDKIEIDADTRRELYRALKELEAAPNG